MQRVFLRYRYIIDVITASSSSYLFFFSSSLVTETHVVHIIRHSIVHLPEEHRDARRLLERARGSLAGTTSPPPLSRNCISSRVCIYFFVQLLPTTLTTSLGLHRPAVRGKIAKIPRLSSRPTLSASLSHVDGIRR